MAKSKTKAPKKTFPEKQPAPVQNRVAINALNSYVKKQSSVGLVRRYFHDQSSFDKEYEKEVNWLAQGVI